MLRPSNMTATGNPLIRRATIAVGAAVLLLLASLRVFQDQVLGAQFLRAFLARGLFFGFSLLLICAVVQIVVRRSRLTAETAATLLITGLLTNLLATLFVAYAYDEDILKRVAERRAFSGFSTIVCKSLKGDERTMTLRLRGDRCFEHRETGEITNREIAFVTGIEDVRFYSRLIGIDPVAVVRALTAVIQRKELQGASGINQQLAGLLFGLNNRNKDALLMLEDKLLKTVLGLRLDDLLSRSEQIELYLSCAPFGSIGGHEVIGIAAASRVFYGVEPASLSDAQLAELLSRLKNPNIYFPYPKDGEKLEEFERRKTRLIKRARLVLERAEDAAAIDRAARGRAEGELLLGLRPKEDLLRYLQPFYLNSVFDELRRRVPDIDSRRLEVTIHMDERAQALLLEAAESAREEIASAAAPLHPGDSISIDAAVIDEAGSIAARLGLEHIPGGLASQVKPEIYGVGLEFGVLNSMSEEVLPGLSAADGLAFSNNEAVKKAAVKIGIERVAKHFESQGYTVVGPYLPIVLGAGLAASPRTVAAGFAKFGYSSPGCRIVEPRIAAQVRDGATGEILYEAQVERIFRSENAIEVRRALEKAALVGTARKLAPLAKTAPLAAKTGTAAFLGDDGKHHGEGGSWIVVADSVTKTTVAIRVRLNSGKPLELEGGQTAALVARKFISGLRNYYQGGSYE